MDEYEILNLKKKNKANLIEKHKISNAIHFMKQT